MLFSVNIPTPANTPEASPVVTRVRVYPGVTGQTWVGFPPGPKGLAHMRIYHWGSLVWPTYTGAESWATTLPTAPGIVTANPLRLPSFAWDNYVFTFQDPFPLTAEPFEFVIKTWNEDDFYPHTIFFAIIINPAPPEEELRRLHRTLEALGILRGGGA